MSRYISKQKRQYVRERAIYCCEYCRVPELFSYLGYEIDHVIPKKHGGTNELDNLAFACAICNNFKGTDLSTVLLPSTEIIRLYNPRIDKWDDHFEVSGALIVPKTKVGEGTIKIFQLNNARRLEEREMLIFAGLFPPPDYPIIN